MTHPPDELAADLRRAVPGGVSAGRRRLAEYAGDASNYRHVPRAVVFPAGADEVAAALAVARAYEVPVTMRGGGTSIGGSAIGPGVIIDCSRRFGRVLQIDPHARTARVEPGVVLDDLRVAAAAHGLTFGPDPSTHGRCTLGGMIGNNACGSRSRRLGADGRQRRDTRRPAGGRDPADRRPDAGPGRRDRRRWAARGARTRRCARWRTGTCPQSGRAAAGSAAQVVRLPARAPAAGARLRPGARSRRHRRHVRGAARRDRPPGAAARGAGAARAGFRRPGARGRRRPGDPAAASPGMDEGIDAALLPGGVRPARTAGRSWLAVRGVRRRIRCLGRRRRGRGRPGAGGPGRPARAAGRRGQRGAGRPVADPRGRGRAGDAAAR